MSKLIEFFILQNFIYSKNKHKNLTYQNTNITPNLLTAINSIHTQNFCRNYFWINLQTRNLF